MSRLAEERSGARVYSKSKPNPAKMRVVRLAYEGGMSVHEIEGAYRVSTKTIRKWVAENDWKRDGL